MNIDRSTDPQACARCAELTAKIAEMERALELLRQAKPTQNVVIQPQMAAAILARLEVKTEQAQCPPFARELNDSIEAVARVIQEELSAEGRTPGLANCAAMAGRIIKAVCRPVLRNEVQS